MLVDLITQTAALVIDRHQAKAALEKLIGPTEQPPTEIQFSAP
jgi:hypothetical protein